MSLNDAIQNAQSKAAGIFPPDLARVLASVSHDDWQVIRWIEPPKADRFIADVTKLAEQLILWG
jgi:hypothetical protein